jgi:SIR2-like domain
MTVQSPLKAVLLTGAGFSKPFGGYLAAEVWAAILRQPPIRRSPALRERLLKEMNFEAVYEDVMTAAPPEEQTALTEAVWHSYLQMHAEMSASKYSAAGAATYGVCQKFLARFATQQPMGLVFTLNQDLLVETYNTGDVPVWLPGAPAYQSEDGRETVTLPKADAVKQLAGEFWNGRRGSLAYVKLHGSFNWRSADETRARAMVIGTNKGRLLDSEPLLHWYLQLFEEALKRAEALLIIGYSFRDPHINRVIAQAAKMNGLRLYIISPQTPEDFRAHLVRACGGPIPFPTDGDAIWESLYGYYCNSVEKFYIPNEQALPPRGRALFSDLGL